MSARPARGLAGWTPASTPWGAGASVRCGCVSADRRAGRSSLASLPARLGHAGDQALARQLAQHVAAHLELAVVAARAPGQLAPVANARRRRVARHLGQLETGRETLLARLVQVVGKLLQPLPLGGVAGHQLPAVIVLVDRALLSHASPPVPGASGLAEGKVETAQ